MLSKFLDVMKDAAVACGDIILDRSAMAMGTSNKSSRRDVVTQYDVTLQNMLVERLSKAFPEAAFVTEEGTAASQMTQNLIFVIDPLDGTMNFVKDYGHSCISIGCLVDGKPAAGVVYDPYRKELFSGARGMGAYLNGEPVAVTAEELSDTLVLFGTSPYNMETTAQTFEALAGIYGKCLDIRRMGSAALDLCYVACGRAGLYFEARLSLWDYAAGALIVTEAGGTAMKMDGSPLDYGLEKSSVLVGSPLTIGQSGLLAKEV